MMSKKMIKVICIIMAALMILSVGAVVLQVIAVDEMAVQTYVAPSTGESFTDVAIPAGIILFALIAVGICIILPRIKKTNSDEE